MPDPTLDPTPQEMEAALEAERAEFQRRLEEERATLAAVLAEEKSKLEDHLNAQKKLFDEVRVSAPVLVRGLCWCGTRAGALEQL